MSWISATEQWLSHTTGGHPVLVPALILGGILIILAIVADFIVTGIIHPVLKKLGLRSRGGTLESSRSITSGEIIPAAVRPEPESIRLHKAMFVAGACVAVASVGIFLALSRRRLNE